MKQLLQTDLRAVPVPMDAKKYQIVKAGMPSILGDSQFANGSYWELWYETEGRQTGQIVDLRSPYILGTATENEISFDPEPFVDKEQNIFKDYTNNEFRFYSRDSNYAAKAAFYSMMKASGLFFVNPFGDKPHNIGIMGVTLESDSAIMKASANAAKRWQNAQQSTSSKWLILREKN